MEKYKKAFSYPPGGCGLEAARLTRHIKGFGDGAKVSIHHGKIDAQAENLLWYAYLP